MDPVGVGVWEVATGTVDMEVMVVTVAMVIARSDGDTVAGDSDR